MIYDKLKNIRKYCFENKGLKNAIKTLEEIDLSKLDTGYRFDCDEFSITVNEYITKPEDTAKYEMHKKAIDIHVVLDGTEYIECNSADEVEICDPYDEERDIAFGYARSNCSIDLNPGWFLIFFPQDAHLVGAHKELYSKIKKCIIKVKY